MLDNAVFVMLDMNWIRFREFEILTQCKAMAFEVVLQLKQHFPYDTIMWLLTHVCLVHEVFVQHTPMHFPKLQVFSLETIHEHFGKYLRTILLLLSITGPNVAVVASSITEPTSWSLRTIPCAMHAAG